MPGGPVVLIPQSTRSFDDAARELGVGGDYAIHIAASASKSEFIASLKMALDLPEYLHDSWDSLSDCLCDFVMAREGDALVFISSAGVLLRDEEGGSAAFADIVKKLPEPDRQVTFELSLAAASLGCAAEPRRQGAAGGAVDTHVHFYDPGRAGGVPWPPAGNKLLHRTVAPQHLVEAAGDGGIGAAIAVECSPLLEDNAALLSLAERSAPYLKGVVGHIVPGRPEFHAEVSRFAEHPLFLGIRVHDPPAAVDGGSWLAEAAHLAACGLTLDLIGQPTPTGTAVGARGVLSSAQLAMVAELAGRLPRLRVVLDHACGLRIDGAAPPAAWLRSMAAAAARPNVWLKVSGSMEASTTQPAPTNPGFYAPTFEALWRLFGPDRLVYGSNWPVCDRAPPVGGGQPYAAQLALTRGFFEGKGPGALEQFLWRGSQAAYGWS
jgi:L-fuconolactonase